MPRVYNRRNQAQDLLPGPPRKAMTLRSIKQRLADGETLRVFAVGRIVHPIVIEMFGLAGGYEGFWIDAEHIALNSEQILCLALAGRANGFDCFVRIAPTGYSQVTQCLETGAGGVMVAQIHSADHAAQFVRWAKFAPRGARGLNSQGRDADYTHKPAAKFVEDANRELLTAIQIETAGALEDVEAIAALDDVDLVFVGPADLSLALGCVGDFHHPRLWEAIERVAAACRKHGKPWGAVTPDPKFCERALENGCRMATIGNELLCLRKGLESLQSAFPRP
jgi:2-dehydro-3-deoxyglucarate aldolase/4-hydroxy-2-oxoheptanedioate aldolase